MQTSIALSEITMNYRSAGEGPLMVLLHGWPQTSLCWRHVMPALAEHFHVVAPDLRGYGRTDKPVGDYSKRRMAQDIRELVDALGYDELRLVGHDRGARVAHRFALDHGDVLSHLTLLDIKPTLHAFRRGTAETAAGHWHWLFHQRADLPELLVGSNIEAYLRYFFVDWAFQRARVEEEISSYVAAFSEPGALRSGFDDYRATSVDLEHDQRDYDRGRRVELPVQILWGDRGQAAGDVLEAWEPFAPRRAGQAVPECGHFIPEEQPTELTELLLAHHLG
jgi:haloacetate dehalogenase